MKISVIGAGAWGTTLANLLSKNDHEVLLWVLEEDLFRDLKNKQENTLFLPGISLSPRLQYTQKLEDIALWGDVIIFGSPLRFLRNLALKLKPHLTSHKLLINISKGIETVSFQTGSFILKDIFNSTHSFAALSGPNIAREIAEENFAKSVIAGENSETLKILKTLFETPYFRIYCSDDLLGVELGGALKNVFCLAAGLCDGLQLNCNTKSALLTRGLYEMVLVGKNLGAKGQTFYGLSGVGDLMTSSFSKEGRNRMTGELLGLGRNLDEIKETLGGKTSEGVYTVEALYHWNQKQKLSLPISSELYKILHEKKNPKEAFLQMWVNQSEEDVCNL